MSGASPLEVLERFRKPRPRPGERCEMCNVEVAPEHGHVVDLRSRSLMCSCRACYLLFSQGGAGGGHYRAVPEDFKALPAGTLTRADWETLQVPVGVAFYFQSSTTGEVHGFYPGPAGATESVLDRAPEFSDMAPDVEALLVRATQEGEPECYVVPIDACYELVGHLRMLWKGFDGGSEARQAIDEFFAAVRARARPR